MNFHETLEMGGSMARACNFGELNFLAVFGYISAIIEY